MKLERQRARIDTGGPDEDGCLVFGDGKLVAVLVRLSLDHENAGRWFLEHGFGPLDRREHPIFDNLEMAERWIAAKRDE